VYTNNPHTVDNFKKATTEYIQIVDRAILKTVFENTVRPVNKCLESGGLNFEDYLYLSIWYLLGAMYLFDHSVY